MNCDFLYWAYTDHWRCSYNAVTIVFTVFVFLTGSIVKSCSRKTNEITFKIGYKDKPLFIQFVDDNTMKTNYNNFYLTLT